MSVDFTKPVLLMPDGSYVVALVGGLPYNVLEADPLWQDIQTWLAKGNKAVLYAPPVATISNLKVTAHSVLQAIMLEYVNSIMEGPTAPSAFATQWLAAWKVASRQDGEA